MRRIGGQILSLLGFLLVALGLALFISLRAQTETGNLGVLVFILLAVFIGLLLFGVGHILFLIGSGLTSGLLVRVLAFFFTAVDALTALLLLWIAAQSFGRGDSGLGVFSLLVAIGFGVLAVWFGTRGRRSSR